MSVIVKSGTYPLSVYDNEIPQHLMLRVYNFLLDSEYCINFYDQSHSNWYPRDNKLVTPRERPAALRTVFGWDEDSIKNRAPVISELWETINSTLLNNRFVIDGYPESMNYMTGISPVDGPTRSDGSPGRPKSAWRVYGDGMDREYRARSKAVHRDNNILDSDRYYNVLYFANLEWHPQLYGETLFHSNDADTGDYTGKYEDDQPRSYPIGDVENVVSPRPGRVAVWDGRYLHQIKPVACYAPETLFGIVFRVKLKDEQNG